MALQPIADLSLLDPRPPILSIQYCFYKYIFYFLLSSDVRSEESIAIIKKISTSIFLRISILYQSLTLKKCFRKKCQFIYLSVLNQLTDIVEIRYLGSSANIQGLLFLIFLLPLNYSSHKKRNKNSNFLKKGINNFDQILYVYRTFDTQLNDTIGFSGKNP